MDTDVACCRQVDADVAGCHPRTDLTSHIDTLRLVLGYLARYWRVSINVDLSRVSAWSGPVFMQSTWRVGTALFILVHGLIQQIFMVNYTLQFSFVMIK